MIDSNGFKISSYDEIKESITKAAQDRFGADIATDDNSVIGSVISFISSIYNEIEQKQEDSYNSSFLTSATGISLDRLANNFGINRKLDNYAILTIDFKGKPDYVVKANTSYQTSDGLIFVLSSDVKLDSDGNGSGIAYANETGEKYNIGKGISLIQVQPVNDLSTSVSGSIGAGGSDKETDKQLRDRLSYAAKGVNSSTYNGIVSAIKEVAGVSMVRIIENHTDQNDVYGNPPYSIHIYVSGGDDNGVARSIFNSLAIGINTYGSLSISVNDDANNNHIVMFDRPNQIDINSKITIHTTESFPLDGVQQIKEQIYNYLSTLNMGDTVRYSYIFKYIYDNVAGVSFADVVIGKDSDKGNLKAQDIVISPFEIAKYNADKVEVVIDNG